MSARAYPEYLKSPKYRWWWELRWFVINERAGGRCECYCGRTATQVHHLNYPIGRREEARDLIAVCDACHTIQHYPEAVNDNLDPDQVEMEL